MSGSSFLLVMMVIPNILCGICSAFADETAEKEDPATHQGPGIIVRSGEKIAFLGASITEFGWTHPRGYLQLFVQSLAANGVKIVPVPAGVSGNTSRDMLARLDRDVIRRKPDWMAVDAGRNDIWHESVPMDETMANMAAIVDKAQRAGIRVIIQTVTPITEDLIGDFNKQLASYNQFLRHLVGRKKCVLADLNEAAVQILKTKTTGENILTTDGVHMNDRGDRVMAAGLLKALGLTNDQIERTTPATV